MLGSKLRFKFFGTINQGVNVSIVLKGSVNFIVKFAHELLQIIINIGRLKFFAQLRQKFLDAFVTHFLTQSSNANSGSDLIEVWR